MLADICRECSADAGTPWPGNVTGTCSGPCNWCGNGERALMPFDDLEHTDFEEEKPYA
jgi:hypothetical protein